MSIAVHLGQNVQTLRAKLGLSQHELGSQAGIPRSTIANIESGHGNPSLSNLARIGHALQVSLEELVAAPHPEVAHYRPQDIPVVERGLGRIHKLLPDPIPGMEVDRVFLKPKGRVRGVPHVSGTKEYLICLNGRVRLHVDGEAHDIQPGEVLSFPGDRAHSYFNPGSKVSDYISVVAILPRGL